MTETARGMHVELTGGPFGHSCVLRLDGVDVSSKVRAISIRAEVGEPIMAMVELVLPDITLDLEAMVGGVVIPLLAPGDPPPVGPLTEPEEP